MRQEMKLEIGHARALERFRIDNQFEGKATIPTNDNGLQRNIKHCVEWIHLKISVRVTEDALQMLMGTCSSSRASYQIHNII